MAASEFLTGLGYLYQGAWLGVDTSAFKKVTIRTSDIQATEEDNLGGRPFMRVITRTGAVFIVFQVNDPRPTPTGRVIDATTIRPALATDSQESVKKPPKRVICLPAPKSEKGK